MQSSLYDTLPACCISKVVVKESVEIIYEKVCESPRPPPKISFKDNWMNELFSDVAGSSPDSNESNQNHKPDCPEREDPCVRNKQVRSPKRSK